MDPVSSGAVKGVQQGFVQDAEQAIQKSNQKVSDFEKLREKLEQQDAVSNPSQLEAMDKMNQTQHVQHADQVNQVNQVDPSQQVQGAQPVPEVKSMDELQGMVNNIRDGQKRLNEIIHDATSGRTYSPSELLALQAEVGKISNELEMAMKVVENGVSGIKTAFNMNL